MSNDESNLPIDLAAIRWRLVSLHPELFLDEAATIRAVKRDIEALVREVESLNAQIGALAKRENERLVAEVHAASNAALIAARAEKGYLALEEHFDLSRPVEIPPFLPEVKQKFAMKADDFARLADDYATFGIAGGIITFACVKAARGARLAGLLALGGPDDIDHPCHLWARSDSQPKPEPEDSNEAFLARQRRMNEIIPELWGAAPPLLDDGRDSAFERYGEGSEDEEGEDFGG